MAGARVTAVVVGLALAVTPTAALAADDARGRTAFTPGAAGIGDPYFPLDGNGGYDVDHYDLDLRYDPGTDVLTGEATITARATQDLSAFNLDLAGLRVRSVEVEGRPATWARDGAELTVTPARGLRDRLPFRVVVRYDGVPDPVVDAFGLSGFLHTDDGAVVTGQPHVAATWFPVNDHPTDPASYSVAIEVPAGLEAVSNGVLRSTRERAGWTTWQWEARDPMASYLAVLAVGDLDVREYVADGVRYWDAIDPDLFAGGAGSAGEVAAASFARQPEIVDFLSGLFGRYPFRTAGGIAVDTELLTFALESQTRPIYPGGAFGDPVAGDSVVVHELAHQWAGDALPLAGWQHIWLNEGVATYAEWLWREREGVATAQETFDALASLPADDPFWTTVVADPGPEGLFDAGVYDRGAMTLHALRLEVGDDAFFEILRRWLDGPRGRVASTEAFVALAEEVAGRSLDGLVDAWLYSGEKPGGLD